MGSQRQRAAGPKPATGATPTTAQTSSQPISITPAGYRSLVATAMLLPMGIVFAMPELIALAIVPPLLMCVVAGAWSTDRSRVEARRFVDRSSHFGDTVHYAVEVTAGRRRTGVLRVCDSTDAGPEPDVLFAPIGPGDSSALRADAAPGRRGNFQLGPVEVTQVDPVGLLSRRRYRGAQSTVIVRPRIHPLLPLGRDSGRLDNADWSPWAAPTRRTEELAGLRPYQSGDDIRHVHWAAVARTGNLVIRQFEHAESRKILIVLDDRPSAQTASSFERAVEAATSVLVATMPSGRTIQLATCSGFNSGPIESDADVERALDYLSLSTLQSMTPSDSALKQHLGGDLSLGLGGTIIWCGAGRPDRLPGTQIRVLAEAHLIVVDCGAGFATSVASQTRPDVGESDTTTDVIRFDAVANFVAAWNEMVKVDP